MATIRTATVELEVTDKMARVVLEKAIEVANAGRYEEISMIGSNGVSDTVLLGPGLPMSIRTGTPTVYVDDERDVAGKDSASD